MFPCTLATADSLTCDIDQWCCVIDESSTVRWMWVSLHFDEIQTMISFDSIYSWSERKSGVACRSKVEETARRLSKRISIAGYHAGMRAQRAKKYKLFSVMIYKLWLPYRVDRNNKPNVRLSFTLIFREYWILLPRNRACWADGLPQAVFILRSSSMKWFVVVWIWKNESDKNDWMHIDGTEIDMPTWILIHDEHRQNASTAMLPWPSKQYDGLVDIKALSYVIIMVFELMVIFEILRARIINVIQDVITCLWWWWSLNHGTLGDIDQTSLEWWLKYWFIITLQDGKTDLTWHYN